jgi:hypothetical protein
MYCFQVDLANSLAKVCFDSACKELKLTYFLTSVKPDSPLKPYKILTSTSGEGLHVFFSEEVKFSSDAID